MSRVDELVTALGGVGGLMDDAVSALAAAAERAQESFDAFAALGGSAERAQAVLDTVEQVLAQAQASSAGVAETVAAVQPVDALDTPEESATRLEAAVARIEEAADAVRADLSAVDDAITETHGHLRGSSAADEIAALLSGAQDALEAAQSALGTARDEAEAQAAAYRGELTPGTGSGAGPAPSPAVLPAGEARQVAARRAADLQARLPAGSQGRVTMGVGLGTDQQGRRRTVIGTSERNGYLRPGVRAALQPDDEIATGNGHAECNILDHMRARQIRADTVGAGRPICPQCAQALSAAGASPATPLRNP